MRVDCRQRHTVLKSRNYSHRLLLLIALATLNQWVVDSHLAGGWMQRNCRRFGFSLLLCTAGYAGYHWTAPADDAFHLAPARSSPVVRSGCTQAILDRATGWTRLGACSNSLTLTARLSRSN